MNPPTQADLQDLWRALYGGWRMQELGRRETSGQCSPMMLDQLIALRNTLPHRASMTYRARLAAVAADPCLTADERAFLEAALAMETL